MKPNKETKDAVNEVLEEERKEYETQSRRLRKRIREEIKDMDNVELAEVIRLIQQRKNIKDYFLMQKILQRQLG